MRANNYFDGPFDQLPDNFIEGETLRDAILAVRPQLKGQIDRFGSAPDGSIRFMIGPYLPYQRRHAISTRSMPARRRNRSRPDYYRCFVTDDESGGMVAPKPQAQRRRETLAAMDWTDEGIVLGVRRHGEANAILEVMTRAHGRHLGLVRGGAGSRMRPVLQPGNVVRVDLARAARRASRPLCGRGPAAARGASSWSRRMRPTA